MSNHSVQCVVAQYGVLCTQVSMQHEERSEVGTGLLECLFDSQGVRKGEPWKLIARAYRFGGDWIDANAVASNVKYLQIGEETRCDTRRSRPQRMNVCDRRYVWSVCQHTPGPQVLFVEPG